jgi:exodeoxyribonuclease VII small subunit
MKSKTTNSFEKNIEKLEKISNLLESEDIGLEEAIQYYEEGIELSQTCLKTLNEAELKVTELKKKLEETDSKIK